MKIIFNILCLILLISSCSPTVDRSELFSLTDAALDSLPSFDKIEKESKDKEFKTKDGKYEIHSYSRSITIYVRNIYNEYDELQEYEMLEDALFNRYANDKRVNEVRLEHGQYGETIWIDCYTPNPIQKDMDINEEFIMEWSSPSGDDLKDIVKIMVRYKLKMCGEFYYKGSVQDPNKNLIACSPDGKNFNMFIINTLGDGWIESLDDKDKAKLKRPY